MEKGRPNASFFTAAPNWYPNSALVRFFFDSENQAEQTGYVFWALNDDNFHGDDSFSPTMQNHKAPPGRQARTLAFCYLQHQKDQNPHPKSTTASMAQTKRKESITPKSRTIPTMMATQGSCLRVKSGLFMAGTTPFPSFFGRL